MGGLLKFLNEVVDVRLGPSNKASLLRETRQTIGHDRRSVRDSDGKARLRAPGSKKYFTRGPCPPIAVEMRMVPGTPVCAVVRFAISTTSSLASSSANNVSAGI